MRFPTQATLEDLQPLIAGCDDRSGSHLLWIHREGEVHTTRIEPGQMACDVHERIFLSEGAVYMFETLACGGGWVGPEAASDPSWMADLHAHLSGGWARYQKAQAEGRPRTTEIEGMPNLFELLLGIQQQS